jgi:hypothetical protein
MPHATCTVVAVAHVDDEELAGHGHKAEHPDAAHADGDVDVHCALVCGQCQRAGGCQVLHLDVHLRAPPAPAYEYHLGLY